MANPFHSASWFSVARLRPRLKSHVRVRRHFYRGNRWYVIDDGAAGKAHRFPRGAYLMVGRLDGARTVEQIWDVLVRDMGEEAPTQDDVIAALGQLHGADLLATDTLPDATEMATRHKKQKRQIWLQNLKSPLSLRLPLVDPELFLEKTMLYVRPLFSWLGALIWLAVVIPATVIASANWEALTGNLVDRVLATDNLLVAALCYPVVKLIHEFGHGYAAKAQSREVREMGVMLLMFFPVPYVDISSASALKNKWKRALIGAAGMIAEVFVAALAVYAWMLLEPGILRAFAFNVILIAGISTVLVNGNPLLRFDGYYILADVLEIPNLAGRANQYWSHLFERHVFKVQGGPPFAATEGEKVWLLLYAPASFVARMVMLIGLALAIASQFFLVGVLIALWTVWTGIGLPVWKMFAHVFTSPQLHRNRQRAVQLTTGGVAAVFVLLFAVPAPHHAYTQGIVWLPEEAHVRAGTDGLITQVATSEGTQVKPGQLLLKSEHAVLEAETTQLAWRVRELQAQSDTELTGDRVKRELSELALIEARKNLAAHEQRLGELEVKAGVEGRFVVAAAPADDLPGRFMKKGDLVGYVTPGYAEVARVAVSQDDADLVRGELRGVSFRLASLPGRSFAGKVVRMVPEATARLPSAALTIGNGGVFPGDPRDQEGRTALSRVFLFDIALPSELRSVPFGTRVHVRFWLGWEPLGWQGLRRLRQMFLARFDV